MVGCAALFAPEGPLARAHPAYEYRPGQQKMAQEVERTLAEGGVLFVEAGTGTGKTLAYLVPALRSGRRVVVSTGTRNLQDQIWRQDLPFLRERMGLRFTAAIMKGRDNYLCRLRFARFREQPWLESAEEARWIPILERWAERTRRGDRAEIGELPDQLRLWREINARADTCLGPRCPEYGDCWLTHMKRAAEHAQLVVVNHHLFFADLAVRTAYGAVIPPADTVIFDEAHLLEEVATLYFGLQVSSLEVEDLAREAERLAAARGGSAKGGGGAPRLREAAEAFFAPLRETIPQEESRVRFLPPERGGPRLDAPFASLAEALSEVAAAARRTAREGDPGEALEARAHELRGALERILARDDPAFVYTLERRGRHVTLAACPVDIAGLLRERLFDELHAAVLTSATLAVAGRFDFFASRLGAEQASTLVVESPFAYREQAVLYLPHRMPEPREAGFLERAVEEIATLLEITDGRAFLLFTSFAHLERVRVALEALGRWPLVVQGEGSKIALVETFKRTPRAVLLGTSSFWHGVDVPGEALSLVVIDKLPFDVPTDPVIAARIEAIRERGGNPFLEYQVPLAVLELKQGLGRLLRHRQDRGILAVLDPRLTTRAYGRIFLRSLPPYRIARDIEACRRFFCDQRAGPISEATRR